MKKVFAILLMLIMLFPFRAISEPIYFMEGQATETSYSITFPVETRADVFRLTFLKESIAEHGHFKIGFSLNVEPGKIYSVFLLKETTFIPCVWGISDPNVYFVDLDAETMKMLSDGDPAYIIVFSQP
jgi:hypothetical protein